MSKAAKKSKDQLHRELGATNIDLWVDGAIYPKDPATRVPPPFKHKKNCLQFVCHGRIGLLGDTNSLGSGSNNGEVSGGEG